MDEKRFEEPLGYGPQTYNISLDERVGRAVQMMYLSGLLRRNFFEKYIVDPSFVAAADMDLLAGYRRDLRPHMALVLDDYLHKCFEIGEQQPSDVKTHIYSLAAHQGVPLDTGFYLLGLHWYEQDSPLINRVARYVRKSFRRYIDKRYIVADINN